VKKFTSATSNKCRL